MNAVLTNTALFFSKTYAFLNTFLKNQLSKSKHTYRSYSDSLSIFRRFVCIEKEISIQKFYYSDCNYEFVLEFMEYLQKKLKSAPTTVNTRLAAIKAYMHYAADTDISVTQSWLSVSRVPLLEIPKLQKPIIDDAALIALLAAPKLGRFAVRDRAFLAMLFDTAVRIDELLSTCICNLRLDVEEPYLRILGKGDKERIVPVLGGTIQLVKSYLANFHAEPLNPNAPLFYTYHDNKINVMTERNAERIVKKYADLIREQYPDLPDKVYPHMFRRTRATGLYRDGVDIEEIARILGHSSAVTTKKYAIPSVKMLREAMQGTSPKVEEEPLWAGKEDDIIRQCGLRP